MGMGCLTMTGDVATDYAALLDDEVRAFIARTEEFYPPDAVDLSITDQRRVYDALCVAFDYPHPEGVRVRDTEASGVPVRIYNAGDPSATIVYFHGGGFVVGGLESHDAICAELCAGTGYRVVAVDYRLAPEYVFPAAVEDAIAATRWVGERYEGRILLAGDSAGGNLAAAVSGALRGQDIRLRGQVLIYPGLGGNRDARSYHEHAFAPGLTAADVDFYHEVYGAGAERAGNPRLAPLEDSDFSGLPPTVVITADCDPLRDDGPAYCDALAGAGVRAHCINENGLIHGYLRARYVSQKARDSFERIVAALQCLGQGLWPYD